MKLKCKACGQAERFTAIEEVLRTVVVDGDGDPYDWKNEDVQDTRAWECGGCQSDQVVDLDNNEDMNAAPAAGEPQHWAMVRWSIEDIHTLRPAWDDDKCAAFLDKIENNLEERMTERGWDVIEQLIEEEGGLNPADCEFVYPSIPCAACENATYCKENDKGGDDDGTV